jgi:RecA-family ATPase
MDNIENFQNDFDFRSTEINTDYFQKLDKKAFELLPHSFIYDDQRQKIGMIDNSAVDNPETTYEKFIEQADICRENDDESSIRRLALELIRKECNISLVKDVSQFAQPDWIVEGLVVRSGLALLVADSGVGKTTLCLYLADCIQEGKNFFGLKCKRGLVVFVEQDESPELLRSHKDRVGVPNNLTVADIDVSWDANSRRFNGEFDQLFEFHMPDVLIIDALSSINIPDITRPESALALDELRRLAEQHKCGIVILHHTNKSGEQMGSNLHKAKMDSMISLSKLEEDKILITQEKVRGGKFEPKTILFDRNNLKMTEANVSLKLQVRELRNQGVLAKDIINRFPKQQRDTIRRYLREPLTEQEAQDRIKKGRK